MQYSINLNIYDHSWEHILAMYIYEYKLFVSEQFIFTKAIEDIIDKLIESYNFKKQKIFKSTFLYNDDTGLYLLFKYSTGYNSIVCTNSESLIEDLINSDYASSLSLGNFNVKIYEISQDNIEYTTIPVTQEMVNIINPEYFKLVGIDAHKLAQSFINSNDSLLIFAGDAGSGKSKLVFYMSYIIANMYSNSNVTLHIIKGKDIIMKIMQQPSFLQMNSYGDKNIFVFDDIEFTTLKRTNDNSEINSFINFFLSVTDGVIPTNNKFVITTNRYFEDIDNALLRPGRLFAGIELQPISKQNIDSQILNKLIELYGQKDKYTLAEYTSVIDDQKDLSFALNKNILKTVVNNKTIGF